MEAGEAAMLARMRPFFLLSSLFVLLPAFLLPVQAQIHGVPASVTSFGFGGRFNPTPGIAASVTSLGPDGYGRSRIVFGGCCSNSFFGGSVNPPLFSFGRHRDGFRHHSFFPAGFAPAYVPYTQYVAVEPDDDYSYTRGPIYDDEAADRARVSRRSEEREPAPAPAAAEPVPDQPSTVLVFKDGHKAEVGNYAIVGDTLFELADGRTRKILLADLDLPATRKANDDLGGDFQVPAHAAR